MRGALLLAAHCAASAAYVPAPGGHVGTARFGEAAHVAACPARNAAPLGGLRCEMTKLETSAVQRMTKDFGKLCKNCPTLLQPRVDTLTEMIMGLPAAEREELLATVAQRVEAAGAEADGVRTPRETYDFQRTGVAGAGAGISPEPSPIPGALPAAPTGSMKKTNDDDKMQRKLMDKVDKYTGKLAKNEMKLQRAVRMLAVADKLIAAPDSERITTPLPEAAIDAMDKEIPMDIAELRMKTVAEIEMKKLKYMEKHAKYTRKVAECRRDLAEAKMKLEAYQASKAAPAAAR